MSEQAAETAAQDAAATEAPTQSEQLGDGGKAALDAERKRAREAEKELKAIRAQLAAFEDANKSETQKAAERATAAEQAATQWQGRYTEMLKRTAITDAASSARAVDTETVYMLIRDDVEMDADGNPVGVEKAIKALQSAKPFLFNTVPAGARDAAAGRNNFPLNDHDSLTAALMGAVNSR